MLRTVWKPNNAAPMKSVTAISSIPSLNKAFRTLFTLRSATTNPTALHVLPGLTLQNSPLCRRPITLTFSVILRRQSHSVVNHGFISSRKKPNFAVVKCISSISSSAHTVDWNDAVSCSEIGLSEAEELALEQEEDDDASATAIKPYVPVRAFFFSTRFVRLSIFPPLLYNI